MHYPDGQPIEPGDLMLIAGQYRGRVIASMDTSRYLPGQEYWGWLERGIMVDTDFGGLIHYTDETAEHFELIARAPARMANDES